MANTKKTPARRPASKGRAVTGKRRSNGQLWAWLAIGLVVAVIATIVIIKTTSSEAPGFKATLTSQSLYNQVTNIPESVYNTVGITSPVIQVNAPGIPKQTQVPFVYPQGGKAMPGAFYVGAEYCPFCAATRWGIIAALSRFGTFNNVLYNMASSPNDSYPNTATFSFYKTTYSSPYLVFKSFETQGPLQGQQLQTVPPREARIWNKWTYDPSTGTSGGIPFMDMGNKAFILGTAYNPQYLAGLTRNEIATGLTDPTNPATQAIVATANYVSAGLCASTKGKPGSVCASSGVMAAAHAMHLTY